MLLSARRPAVLALLLLVLLLMLSHCCTCCVLLLMLPSARLLAVLLCFCSRFCSCCQARLLPIPCCALAMPVTHAAKCAQHVSPLLPCCNCVDLCQKMTLHTSCCAMHTKVSTGMLACYHGSMQLLPASLAQASCSPGLLTASSICPFKDGMLDRLLGMHLLPYMLQLPSLGSIVKA